MKRWLLLFLPLQWCFWTAGNTCAPISLSDGRVSVSCCWLIHLAALLLHNNGGFILFSLFLSLTIHHEGGNNGSNGYHFPPLLPLLVAQCDPFILLAAPTQKCPNGKELSAPKNTLHLFPPFSSSILALKEENCSGKKQHLSPVCFHCPGCSWPRQFPSPTPIIHFIWMIKLSRKGYFVGKEPVLVAWKLSLFRFGLVSSLAPSSCCSPFTEFLASGTSLVLKICIFFFSKVTMTFVNLELFPWLWSLHICFDIDEYCLLSIVSRLVC